MMPPLVDITHGSCPIILAFPHSGTELPPDIGDRLNETGRALACTDWHVHRLYDGLLPEATIVRARFHRYVIDANRDPAGHSLYPGQNTTGLIPTTDFAGQPIWKTGQGPDDADTALRLARFHVPYHDALLAEIERVKALHGVAILYDGHSIRSRLPFLFEGRLPDFNIGTHSGASCDPRIETVIADIARAAPRYATVVNGRFKGGWTTRHYGQPSRGVHAIQMELTQATYLASETAPFSYDEHKADRVRGPLKTMLERLAEIAPTLAQPAHGKM